MKTVEIRLKKEQDELKQIIINILSNAVKFNFPDGKVWFNVEERVIDSFKSNFIFTIKDNGMGMSETFLNHIFELCQCNI